MIVRSWSRTVVLWCAVLAGCGEGPVEIIGTCEPVTEPTRVLPPEQGAFDAAPGIAGDHVLLTWTELAVETEVLQRGQWLDAEFAPAGEPFVLGHGHSIRSRWIPFEGGLVGPVCDEGTPDAPVPPAEVIHRVELTPPPEAAVRRSRAPIPTSPQCPDCDPRPSLSLSSRGQGLSELLPVTMAHGEAWLGANALAGTCSYDREGVANFLRIHVGGTESKLRLDPVLVGDDPCDLDENELTTANPYLFSLEDGGLGVVFYAGLFGGDDRLRFGRIGEDGQLLEAPVVVEGTGAGISGGGFLPRGVATGDGRILFLDRRQQAGFCHALGVMRADGSGARDAPWQMPCMARPDKWMSRSVELQPVPGGAVLVWAQRRRDLGEGAEDYEQRIFATLITPGGRRGSEIVQVTAPESTAGIEGGVGDWVVGAATDGERVVVTWLDRRPDAPGIYARSLRCGVDPSR